MLNLILKLIFSVWVCGLLFFPNNVRAAEPGETLVVCSNTGYGSINAWRFSNLRAKLNNRALFGTSGSLSTNTFRFVITTPTTANLARNQCDIWFSGYDFGPNYTDLAGFARSGGFVMAGCDSSNSDAACAGVGYPVINYRNIPVTFSSGVTPINPLVCDGGDGRPPLTVRTAGGLSAYFTRGVSLAQYNDGSRLAEVITDNVLNPTMLLTADINMWDSAAGVTAGANVISDQDKFAVNTFKFAADSVTGLIAANRGSSCEMIPETVINPTKPPVATADSATVNTNRNATINLSNNITDPDRGWSAKNIDHNCR